MHRADTAEANRRDCYVYMDEFQTFSTLSLANMLSELRKYRLNLVLAHQFLSQLDLQVQDAVLGNVGTILSVCIGATDAEVLEKQYAGEEIPVDLILSDFAASAGLNVNHIWILPQGKGNSSQQMGEHGRRELRKRVYVWS